jgi:hypothetical protein
VKILAALSLLVVLSSGCAGQSDCTSTCLRDRLSFEAGTVNGQFHVVPVRKCVESITTCRSADAGTADAR